MDSNRDEKMTAGQGFQFDERLPDRGVEPHASSSFSLDLAKAYELKPCVGYYLSLRVDGLPGHVFDLVMIAPRGGTTLDCWKGKASESLPRSLPSPKNP
jgi:hypothetical protein